MFKSTPVIKRLDPKFIRLFKNDGQVKQILGDIDEKYIRGAVYKNPELYECFILICHVKIEIRCKANLLVRRNTDAISY